LRFSRWHGAGTFPGFSAPQPSGIRDRRHPFQKMTEKFATEAELCAAFIAALPEGWTAYAETAGHDILLVRAADGFQIGIQAKLKFNAHVLSQTIDDSYAAADRPGPDCRAVLVPSGEVQRYLSHIAQHCGVTVLTVKPGELKSKWEKRFAPSLPEIGTSLAWSAERDWHEMAPSKRHKLPAYVPDVAAGAPAPLQLTDWKIKAIKIAVLLDVRGYAARSDFSHLHLDHRRWLGPENLWLVVEDGKLVKGPRMPDFKAQHPKVYAQIKAEAATWMASHPTPMALAKTERLL
jgi:hypothetical protein